MWIWIKFETFSSVLAIVKVVYRTVFGNYEDYVRHARYDFKMKTLENKISYRITLFKILSLFVVSLRKW